MLRPSVSSQQKSFDDSRNEMDCHTARHTAPNVLDKDSVKQTNSNDAGGSCSGGSSESSDESGAWLGSNGSEEEDTSEEAMAPPPMSATPNQLFDYAVQLQHSGDKPTAIIFYHRAISRHAFHKPHAINTTAPSSLETFASLGAFAMNHEHYSTLRRAYEG
eukprot:SAG31_NODE_7233_length_1748_cov_2.608854_1_plen_161_part_00